MESIQDLLKNKLQDKPQESKHVTQEFQSYALYLAEQLNDMKHRGIYMRMAKTMPRGILSSALSFVSDANTTNKAKLFMWKVKQIRLEKTK